MSNSSNTRRSVKPYEQAMKLCPDARKEEFVRPIELAALSDGDVVVDFPSGGYYLTPYLNEVADQVTVYPVENVDGYVNAKLPIRQGDWGQLPFSTSEVDALLSIAALHHYYPDRSIFYRECLRILKPGGKLIIADVAEGTSAARFLEEFVNEYSSEGHDAQFFNKAVDFSQISNSGLNVEHFEVEDLEWWFDNEHEMAIFCKNLFRLDTIGAEEVLEGIEKYLGFVSKNDSVAMQWQLAMIRGVAP